MGVVNGSVAAVIGCLFDVNRAGALVIKSEFVA